MPENPPTSRPIVIPPQRKVVLCVGPGGVGKTTVAASLGLLAAEQGRRVIVVTIDPSLRLAQALGFHDTSDAGVVVTVPGTEGFAHPLACLLLDTRSVFDEIVRGYSPNRASAERMLTNPIYLATVQHLGGALEYAATARVHMLASSGRYDLIVLDTPPTANAIEFLDAPERIREVLDNPAAKFLAGSNRMGMRFLGLASSVMMKAFESLGGGPFIGQLGQFLADFGGVLREFQRRAGDVAELLVSRDTGVVLTTSATDFSAREAKAFVEVLRERRMNVDGIVLNRVDPPLPDLPERTQLRAALERLHPDPSDAEVERLAALYEGLQAQGARGGAIEADLVRSYPDIPVRALLRRNPPPTGLTALQAMGRDLTGGR